MAIALKNLDELTPETVDTAYALMVQLVQEYNPSIDVKRGVISDLLIYLSAALAAANQDLVDQVRRSNSLLAISEDSTLADTDIVDRLASNYLAVRTPGSSASGNATIIINQFKNVTVPVGSIFTTDDGLTFTSDESYTARTDEDDVAAATDRLLYDMGDDTFSFNISITSTDIGSTYRLARNTHLTAAPIDNSIVTCYTSSDFTGGRDEETNQELSNRLASSASSKTLANRTSIDGLIRSLELSYYDEGFATSVLGYGDGEQQRYHSIFPVALGGRADAYVRTQSSLLTTQLTKTATLVDLNDDDTGVWQFAFTRDEAPGFYEVTRITLLADIANDAVSSFELTSDTRSYDLSSGSTAGLAFLPDINRAVEAAYSRYQTAAIRFTDTETDTTSLVVGTSTATYGLVLSMIPGLAEIQDAVSDRSTRYPIGDCLVRAPVPCFISMTVNLGLRVSDTAPDEDDVKAAIVTAINTYGFNNRLPTSVLVNAIKLLLTGTVSVTSITLQGRVRRPDGVALNYASSNVLEITNDSTNMTTSRTVCFFVRSDDIVISTSIVDSLS
jgi:uncharacterized phage protein gp47/JayE